MKAHVRREVNKLDALSLRNGLDLAQVLVGLDMLITRVGKDEHDAQASVMLAELAAVAPSVKNVSRVLAGPERRDHQLVPDCWRYTPRGGLGHANC